jgi:ubiquinone/menaquinone biosynthesis C-methylase UbiE
MNRYFGVHVLDGEWHALLPRYALLAERVQNQRVLDVGCGTGIGSSLLMELGADRVDGVDYRPKVLELANMKHAKASLNFHRMLLEELSFDDNTFDIALCLDPSHPVTDKNLLEEIDRVVKDDGEYICAIERRTVDGLERLLPQYGYEDAGESIEIPRKENQAPQIGELQSRFDTIERVQQRPTLSYRFEQDSDDRDDASSVEADTRFKDSGDESPGVDILFCGPDDAPAPDTADIQLPYYRLAERLQQLFRDLHRRQSPGGSTREFDEIVDEPDEPDEPTRTVDREFDRRDTQPFRAQTADNSDNPLQEIAQQLRSQLNDLSSWYDSLRNNFRQMRRETRETLARQQDHIEELFNRYEQGDSGHALKEKLDNQADRLAELEETLESLAGTLDDGDLDDDDRQDSDG